MKRYDWLDRVRGGLIFLVVLGHITMVGSIPWWYKYQSFLLSTFHMPLFFAASGFMFGVKEQDTKPCLVIKKKLIALGIPYVIFSCCYVVLNCILQGYVQTNTVVSWDSLYKFMLYPVAQYWFLWSLIVYFAVASLTCRNKLLWRLGMALSVLVLLFAPLMIEDGGSYYKQTGFYIYFAVGIYVGRLMKGKDLHESPIGLCGIRRNLIVVCAMFFAVSYFVCKRGIEPFVCVTYVGNKIGSAAAIFALTIAGSLSFMMLVELSSSVGIVDRFLAYLGRNTWYIYLIHTYFTAGARVLVRMAGISSALAQIIIGLALGIGIPLAVSELARRYWMLDMFFYPQKHMPVLRKGVR